MNENGNEVMINWNTDDFHPVVNLPKKYTVLDLSDGLWTLKDGEKYIGKYNEIRPNMYNTAIFGGIRNIHMGVDIGGPPVRFVLARFTFIRV